MMSLDLFAVLFGGATALLPIYARDVLQTGPWGLGLLRSAPAAGGASDVVSVVIRASLVQLRTPDAMRGRVSAVHSLFTGTSNQLGEFESGLTAALFGAVPAVLIGGFGTIAVAALWTYLFPELRRVRMLD